MWLQTDSEHLQHFYKTSNDLQKYLPSTTSVFYWRSFCLKIFRMRLRRRMKKRESTHLQINQRKIPQNNSWKTNIETNNSTYYRSSEIWDSIPRAVLSAQLNLANRVTDKINVSEQKKKLKQTLLLPSRQKYIFNDGTMIPLKHPGTIKRRVFLPAALASHDGEMNIPQWIVTVFILYPYQPISFEYQSGEQSLIDHPRIRYTKGFWIRFHWFKN